MSPLLSPGPVTTFSTLVLNFPFLIKSFPAYSHPSLAQADPEFGHSLFGSRWRSVIKCAGYNTAILTYASARPYQKLWELVVEPTEPVARVINPINLATTAGCPYGKCRAYSALHIYGMNICAVTMQTFNRPFICGWRAIYFTTRV